jgi:hypothetical protein
MFHKNAFSANTRASMKKLLVLATTNEKIVVRRCVMETMDTQCGKFRFEDDLLHGCILTCDLDGCNKSPLLINSMTLFLVCSISGLLNTFESLL